MVIEICRNMLLRGQKTTREHARDELRFHILRVAGNEATGNFATVYVVWVF